MSPEEYTTLLRRVVRILKGWIGDTKWAFGRNRLDVKPKSNEIDAILALLAPVVGKIKPDTTQGDMSVTYQRTPSIQSISVNRLTTFYFGTENDRGNREVYATYLLQELLHTVWVADEKAAQKAVRAYLKVRTPFEPIELSKDEGWLCAVPVDTDISTIAQVCAFRASPEKLGIQVQGKTALEIKSGHPIGRHENDPDTPDKWSCGGKMYLTGSGVSGFIKIICKGCGFSEYIALSDAAEKKGITYDRLRWMLAPCT